MRAGAEGAAGADGGGAADLTEHSARTYNPRALQILADNSVPFTTGVSLGVVNPASEHEAIRQAALHQGRGLMMDLWFTLLPETNISWSA